MPLFWPMLFLVAGLLESKGMRGDNDNWPRGREVWDPLSVVSTGKDAATIRMKKDWELTSGRIAMVSAFGMIVEELVTGKPLLS